MILTLPESPSANIYWRRHGNILHISATARAYREAVAMLTSRYRVDGHAAYASGDVELALVWHRSRKAGDLDNRVKILGDALQGALFAKDAQIAHLDAWRVDEHPTIPKGHMLIEVSRVSYP